MSFLTPLYALAAMAIALPILFHLIRRRPKERTLISTLMFLEPTPPRLTRQSRIDQWLLLFLRALAIALLAFAFTRPYWNVPAEKDTDKLGAQRMLLIDTSASMRRDGLWKSAMQKAEQIVRQSGPTDAVSVYQFDSALRPLVGIETALQTPASQRQTQAIAALQSLVPTWMHTDLGSALVTAADLLQTDRDSSSESNATTSEIVVVTDFQNGSHLESLAEYRWPASCKVRIERVDAIGKGNARAVVLDADDLGNIRNEANKNRVQRLLKSDNAEDGTDKIRIRVINSPSAATESFRLTWLDTKLSPIESTRTNCQVPAGGALTVRMPSPPAGATCLQLDGDSADFDNRYYLVGSEPAKLNLLCIESSSVSPDETLGYFLQQLPMSDSNRTVIYQTRAPGEAAAWPPAESTPLVVASHALTDADIDSAITYVEQGGNLFWVLDASTAGNNSSEAGKSFDYSAAFKKLTEIGDAKISEARVRQYAMLESVNFKHPLFADLADSKFNDFSKIRFWRHRRLESKQLADWDVLAKFDDGSPALISHAKGSGRIWLLMAGWQPNESQLALSTKFVPMIMGMYRMATPASGDPTATRVGMSSELSNDQRLFGPDGSEIRVEPESGKSSRMIVYAEPGIYRRVSASGAETRFAVNTLESESITAAGGLERLEKLGVLMNENKPTKNDETSRRQLRAVELESQQGWWRWFLVGVVGVIGLESLLCIRKAS